MKKSVSVVIPTYNEEQNIPLIFERVTKLFNDELKEYDYHILFVDNYSADSSRDVIRQLSEKDEHVQYIFYVRNFGFSKSTFYGLTQSTDDCAVLLFADMQDPPETIVDFLREWESGYKVVVGIKNKSQENRIMYAIRKTYYKFMNRITDIEHIEQFTGFGLYDKSVLKTFSMVGDPLPYLRGIVAELAPECKRVFYEQKKREHGKTSFKFFNLYDVAMLGITSYSRVFMRLSTIFGIFVSAISFFLAIITFILKIFHLVDYPIGNAAILFGVFFLGGMQLLFLGILGEYIANINIRSMRHPMIVEEERHNIIKKDDGQC